MKLTLFIILILLYIGFAEKYGEVQDLLTGHNPKKVSGPEIKQYNHYDRETADEYPYVFLDNPKEDPVPEVKPENTRNFRKYNEISETESRELRIAHVYIGRKLLSAEEPSFKSFNISEWEKKSDCNTTEYKDPSLIEKELELNRLMLQDDEITDPQTSTSQRRNLDRKMYFDGETTNLLISSEERYNYEESQQKKSQAIELLGDGDAMNISPADIVESVKTAHRAIYTVKPIFVEVEEDANLFISADYPHEILFKVKNNLNSPTRVTFIAKDDKSILLSIDKFSALINPHETISVGVTVFPLANVGTDRLTLIVNGPEQVTKEVLVDVGSNEFKTDDEPPTIDYSYTSDCTELLLTKCHHGTWTIKISAQDFDSGLRILTTRPKGIYFPDGYTSGTTERVTGYYSASCCTPDLQIIAIDRMNNRSVKLANAYRAPLSFWAIFSIVLVSIVILISVIACIICIRRRMKKEEENFELPVYRGGGARARY